VSAVSRVIAAIEQWLPEADGVTISGGEPFDQPQALHSLLSGIRAMTAVDVLVFSGYPIETLRRHLSAMDGLIDALVSDPYDIHATQTLALRGSDNQRLHFLTPLGERRLAAFERQIRAGEAALDLMFDDDGTVWMAGIPRRGDMERLRQLLAAQGHTAITSQAPPRRPGRDL
jgi:anaerobic ribonucleoside-triphosphate reductase activating protein